MSKEMNKFISSLIKYDFMVGCVFSLILSVLINKIIAGIYLFGILVSVLNFLVHAVIVERCLITNKNRFIIPMNYFIRIALVVLLSVPFITEFNYLIAYLVGYISHYAMMVFCWIRKGERM